VNLTLNFPSGNVSVSLTNPTDTGFTLSPGGPRDVLLNFSITANAYGSYSGTLYANASNGDELTVDIIVDVTSQVCSTTTTQCQQPPLSCTPSYLVIGTYNDSNYNYQKEVFDPSQYITISGSGWTPGYVTLNITGPGGSSMVGYPKVVSADSSGAVSDQWNTAGAASGAYSLTANDSTNTRTSTFSITGCT
jgi:hypothetical protein